MSTPNPAPQSGGSSSRRIRIILVVSVVVISFGLLLKGLLTSAPSATHAAPGAPAPIVGHYAPDVTLRDLSNNPVKLSSLKGKVVAFNFWYAACEPCKYEMPALEHSYEAYQNQGYVVLGVDVVDDPATADQFVHALGVTYPIVRDVDLRAATLYQVTDTPSTFFIDRDGVIRARVVGSVDTATLRTNLAALHLIGK